MTQVISLTRNAFIGSFCIQQFNSIAITVTQVISLPFLVHWYDPCMRRCEYKGGRYVNCYRIRKDFESMTQKEQGLYLKAYYTITTKEPYKSRYAKLIQLHEVNFMKGIHTKEEFFPWHR